MKDVNHDVHEVQECPAAGPDSLNVVGVSTAGFDGRERPLRERPHVGVRGPRGDHEEVGGIAHPPQIEHEDVQRLVRLERANGKPELPADLGCYRLVADRGGNGSPAWSGAGSSIW